MATLPGPEDLPTLLTIGEVAGLLRTSRKAIYAMAERGQLAGAIHIGRRWLACPSTHPKRRAPTRPPGRAGRSAQRTRPAGPARRVEGPGRPLVPFKAADGGRGEPGDVARRIALAWDRRVEATGWGRS